MVIQLLRTKPRHRREFGAGAETLYVNAAITHLPARKARRNSPFVHDCFDNNPSGVNSSPEGVFPQEVRTRPSAAASFLLRRVHFVQNPVGNRPSGVTFSPEGAFSQQQRTRPSLRRHYFRRRETFRRECRWNSPSGAVFSPEGALSRLRALALLACACGEEKVLRTHDQPRRKDLCDDARRQHVRRGHAGGAAENCRV